MKIYKKDHNSELNSRPKYTSGVFFGLVWQAILKRKIMLFSFLILVITLPILYLVYRYQPKAEAAWYDDGWLYRTALTIGNSGSADSNKKVKFDIDTATLYSTGKIQSDCGDSRFTDINGKVLKYYIDSAGGACNTNSTDYYVLVPTINSGNTVIYHYYGNPSVVNGTQTTQFSEVTFSPTSGPSAASEEQSQGPIVYWKFDEGYSNVAYDSTKNSKNGSISGATWQSEDQCISGKCLKFDGINDEVIFSTPITFTGDGTIEAWMKRTSSSDTVLAAGNSYSEGYWFYLTANYVYQNWGNSYVAYNNLDRSFPVNTWYHVALVRSGTTYIIYKDGVQVGSGTGAANTSTLKGVGMLYSGNGGYARNNGFIDDFKVYPYARTAAQIKTDYTSRGSVKGSSITMGGNNETMKQLSNGLVGYWKMDESAGGTAVDSSGNGNSGTYTNGATNTTGKFGNGGSFDGSNDYVDVGTSTSLNIQSKITIAAWVKANSGYQNTFRTIVNKANGTAGNQRQYELRTEASTGYPALYLNCTDGTYKAVIGTSILTAGSWYHVVGSFDGATEKLYINGTLVASTITTCDIRTTSGNLNIGSFPTNSGYYNWPGSIDEGRIYNRALSPAEVAQLYEWAPGPVAHWKMDEGTGGYAEDTSGNNNRGTLTNNPTWTKGRFGKGLSFDGSDDYVIAENSNSLNITSSLTLEAWVNQSAYGVYNVILSKWVAATGRRQYMLGIYTDGIPFFAVRDANVLHSGTTVTQLNTWYHIAGVYNSSSQTMDIFVNGKKDSTTKTSGVPTALPSTISNFEISGYGMVYELFRGKIDDVKIYNYARTQKQIISDMNASHPNVGSPVGSPVAYYKCDEGYGTTANNSGNGGSSLNGT